jgi:hypothetical protein
MEREAICIRSDHGSAEGAQRVCASARLARVMLELPASATSSSSPGFELCPVALVLDCGLTNLTSSNSKTLLTYRKSAVRAWAQLAGKTRHN